MKETKQGLASPEARAAMHELMGAFEAFKATNDARLEEIERKGVADGLLEEKVARIDQAVAGAQGRLDRLMSEMRRPGLGGETSPPGLAWRAVPPHEWEGDGGREFKGYLRSGTTAGLIEVKAGLDTGPTSGGYVVPEQTERLIERRPRRSGRRADVGADAASGGGSGHDARGLLAAVAERMAGADGGGGGAGYGTGRLRRIGPAVAGWRRR